MHPKLSSVTPFHSYKGPNFKSLQKTFHGKEIVDLKKNISTIIGHNVALKCDQKVGLVQ